MLLQPRSYIKYLGLSDFLPSLRKVSGPMNSQLKLNVQCKAGNRLDSVQLDLQGMHQSHGDFVGKGPRET